MGAFADEETIFAPRHVMGWLLFTMSAGFVNASAVMACKNFVTHVTGNVTNLGMDAADTTLAVDYVLLVVSFIAGAMAAVLIAETFRARPKVAFALPILVSFTMLVGIGVAGKAGWLGVFGVDRELGQRAFVMLGILAAAMGMINAAVAVATKNMIRITHLTGPATDIAGNLVRAALGAGAGTRGEARWAALRLAKLASFAVGAGLAARFAARLHFDLFSVSAGILIVALAFTGAPGEGETVKAGEDVEASPVAGDAEAGAAVVAIARASLTSGVDGREATEPHSSRHPVARTAAAPDGAADRREDTG